MDKYHYIIIFNMINYTELIIKSDINLLIYKKKKILMSSYFYIKSTLIINKN